MSNDLISRSALIQSLRGNVLVDVTPNLEQAINEQPTAYDVDKVVEQIEELGCKDCEYADDFERCRKDCDCKEISERAIEIVKSGGIERYEKR